jgi:protein ImuB
MFAALHIPDFPMVAALRGRPELRRRPCAVLTIPAGTARQAPPGLLAVNPAARLAGLAAGWPLNRALVRCPDLLVLGRDAAAEAALRAELLQIADALTPDVEITAGDCLLLDLSMRTKPLAAALETIVSNDIELSHAQALTPDLAHLAVFHAATRGRVVEPADLAALPLEVLGWLAGGEAAGRGARLRTNAPAGVGVGVGVGRAQGRGGAELELLAGWGLRTLGDFMRLPRQALAERLGPAPGRWHDVLHGKVCRLLWLHRPPESFFQAFDFEEPAVALEALEFALKRLLHTLAARLAARQLAADRLDLRLVLESGAVVSRQLRLPEPQTAVAGMLPPLRAWLDSLRLQAAVGRVELDAGSTFAMAAQREWFGRSLPQPERWAETLAKLEDLLGPGRVGIPVPPTSFKPDGFTMRPAVGATGAIPNVGFRPEAALPLRRYRPPCAVAVASEWRAGRPWPLALLSGPHPGRIVDWRGPFPVSGTWWESAAAWQRLEWDIQLDSGHLLRLVYQTPDCWQLEGIYP